MHNRITMSFVLCNSLPDTKSVLLFRKISNSAEHRYTCYYNAHGIPRQIIISRNYWTMKRQIAKHVLHIKIILIHTSTYRITGNWHSCIKHTFFVDASKLPKLFASEISVEANTGQRECLWAPGIDSPLRYALWRFLPFPSIQYSQGSCLPNCRGGDDIT